MVVSEAHPSIEPYESGHLDVGDGHRVFYELSGNPRGLPVMMLHGGPGSGASAGARRYFDPARFHLIQFDQRNCGRSLPHAGDPQVDLTHNTLPHLLADIERLRLMAGAERVLLYGGSWGATLALAYAVQHPQRVLGLLVTAIATTTPEEVDWITRGVGRFFPEAHSAFMRSLSPEERAGNIAAAYHRRLIDPDPLVHDQAAADWCAWEDAILHTVPGYVPLARWSDARFRLCFARLVTHYWRDAAGLAPDHILEGVRSRLADHPAILVHGRFDLGSPLATAWRLHQAWPASELVVVETAGHDGRDPGMGPAIADAVPRLVSRLGA